MIFTKETIANMLRDGVVTVTFTKLDGSERVMKCTLMSEYVPANTNSASNQVLLQETGNDTNISVWDVESNGWRSFRISSVKSVSIG